MAMNIDRLPPEILDIIFSYLDFDSIVAVERVRPEWNDALSSPSLWRNLSVLYESKKTDFEDMSSKVNEHSDLIRNIEVRGAENGRETIALVNECRKLKTLHMIMCRVDLQMVKYINSLKMLVSLYLRNCYKIMGSSHERDWDFDFGSLHNLKRLVLSDFGLSDANVDSLINSNSLSLLDIKKIKLSQANTIRLIDKNRLELRLLHVYGGNTFDDECVRHASECPNVTSFFILRCQMLTDASFGLLKNMYLTSLILWNNINFTEAGLIELFAQDRFSRSLRSLSFSKVLNVTLVLINVLAKKCTSLKFLGIYRCPKLVSNSIEEKTIKELFPDTELFYV